MLSQPAKYFLQFVAMMVSLLFLFVFSTRAQTRAPNETTFVNLRTDGKVTKVVYSEKNAFAGGAFRKAEIVESKQFLNQSNFVIIDRFRKVFPLRQIDVNGAINIMESIEDDLYLFGTFSQVDNQKRQRGAIIQMSTSQLLPAAIDADKSINVIARWNTLLVLGGEFTKINGQTHLHLAAYDTKGYQIAPWAPVLNGSVSSLVIQNNLLFVGGAFTKANNQPRTYLAVFDLESGQLLPYTRSLSTPVVALKNAGNQIRIGVKNNSTPIVISYADVMKASQNATRAVLSGTLTSSPSASVHTMVGITGGTADPLAGELMVDSQGLGFQIPTLSTILTFAIRAFFAIAGLTALFYMLLGGLNWVMSGGDKDAITAAREKIQSAVIGLIMMIVVLSIIWMLEQVIFKRRICLGLTCPVTLPSLIESDR